MSVDRMSDTGILSAEELLETKTTIRNGYMSPHFSHRFIRVTVAAPSMACVSEDVTVQIFENHVHIIPLGPSFARLTRRDLPSAGRRTNERNDSVTLRNISFYRP